MNRARPWIRLHGAYARRMAKWFGRRPFHLRPSAPIISFTFDDFPRSALFTAGKILEEHGVAGTYYTSLGLMTQTAPTGEIFYPDDLQRLHAGGHEVGCHTFHHHPAWETSPDEYQRSVALNASSLAQLSSRSKFQTHSYPINYPRPATKRALAARFLACRGGGQGINQGSVDLNYLNSFFLEQSRDDLGAIDRIITTNAVSCGWLIFSTHDVCTNPTRFGCQPAFFESVVRRAISSGASIVPISSALDTLNVRPMPSSP